MCLSERREIGSWRLQQVSLSLVGAGCWLFVVRMHTFGRECALGMGLLFLLPVQDLMRAGARGRSIGATLAVDLEIGPLRRGLASSPTIHI